MAASSSGMACGPGRSPWATGVRTIDAGNEGLNFLLEHIFSHQTECRRRSGACDHCDCTRIGAIMRFLDRGFAQQARLMTLWNYTSQGEHRRDHDALLAMLRGFQLQKVCADLDRGMVRSAIWRWQARHVEEYDRPLALWVQAREGSIVASASAFVNKPVPDIDAAAMSHQLADQLVIDRDEQLGDDQQHDVPLHAERASGVHQIQQGLRGVADHLKLVIQGT